VSGWPLPGENEPIVEEIRRRAEALRLGDRYAQLDSNPKFPWEEFRSLGAHGLLGLTIPPELGGRGLTLPYAGLALFHLAYHGGTTFAKLALQPEFCGVLAKHGVTEIRDRYFLPLIRGKMLVANQITEPAAGADVSGIEATAVRRGPIYALNGTKTQAAFAMDAHAAIVYARTSGRREGLDGISAFLVPQDLPGIRRTLVPDLGEKWMRRGTVTYSELEVPSDLLIGEEGRAYEYLKEELTHERALLGMIYLGIARASWDETVAHVGIRKAFGKTLAEQQAVAFPLLEDGARLEATWRYVNAVLEEFDRGEGTPGRAALAKWMGATDSLTAIDHAIQFHGGRGYSKELPHEQRWRDVRSGSLAHGPNEIMHLIASRETWPRPPRGSQHRNTKES
jgi:cyclohexanecarboxyl-CoA dehydrogenase